MHIVAIPMLFLIIVCAVRKIPFIGGNLYVAFGGAGVIALLMGGIYNPLDWLMPWYVGLEMVAYIIFICFLGSIFSNQQMETGAMQTILNILRAIFGNTPQGLVFTVLLALYLGGSLLGTVVSVAAVIGLLIVPALDDMGLSPELICAIISTGGSMGALMPPISNAVNIATGYMGIDPMPVIGLSYITVGVGLIFVSGFFCKVYIGNKYSMPKHLIPEEKASAIFKREWKNLIPLTCLITIVMLGSIPGIKFDLPKWLLQQIPVGGGLNFYDWFAKLPLIGGLMNNINLALITGILISFALYPVLRKDAFKKTSAAVKSIAGANLIQVAAGFFLGAFNAGGQMPVIGAWAGSLSPALLKFGGAFAFLVAGMTMGAQSTAQALLTPIMTTSWMATGVTANFAAVSASHLAAAGQGMPPADQNLFIIAGLVASIIHKKVDPLKAMIYTLPYCFYLAAVGILFLYI